MPLTLRADPRKSRIPALAKLPLAIFVAALLVGCSPATSVIAVGAMPAADSFVADRSPSQVYGVLAEHALDCWVGPKGPLAQTHIFYADVAPPSTGSNAEITIHERDRTSIHPWGARAFRIGLTGVGGGTNTQIVMENVKLPPDIAEALKSDVIHWTRGEGGCQAQVVRPPPPDPPPVAAAHKTRSRKKTALKQ